LKRRGKKKRRNEAIFKIEEYGGGISAISVA